MLTHAAATVISSKPSRRPISLTSWHCAAGRQHRKDKPILNAAVYTNAWEQIDEALFVVGAMEPAGEPVPSNEPAFSPANDSITLEVEAPPVDGEPGHDHDHDERAKIRIVSL